MKKLCKFLKICSIQFIMIIAIIAAVMTLSIVMKGAMDNIHQEDCTCPEVSE